MSVDSEVSETSVAGAKSRPKSAISSKLDRKPPGNFPARGKKNLLDHYTLDDLIDRFGRWPTYVLLLRETTPSTPRSFVLGAGMIGILIAIATYYFKH